jgi:hypothetical protein
MRVFMGISSVCDVGGGRGRAFIGSLAWLFNLGFGSDILSSSWEHGVHAHYRARTLTYMRTRNKTHRQIDRHCQVSQHQQPRTHTHSHTHTDTHTYRHTDTHIRSQHIYTHTQ